MSQFRPRPTKRAQQLRNEATDAERRLWQHLSRRQLGGFKFSRQIPIGPFICDFLCRERGLVIELDGGQHAANTARDCRRTAFLEKQGLTVLRFWNNDVLQNTDGVLQVILAKLVERPARFSRIPLPLAGRGAEDVRGTSEHRSAQLGEEPRSGEGVGMLDDNRAHPQPPPVSGRGLS